jgi:nucleotide-binding universal stress UspA family protein
MTEVLACIDFSDATDAVARAAASVAAASAGRLHLLHVAMPEPEIAGWDRGPVAAHTRDDRAAELLEEHKDLRQLAAQLAEAHAIEVIPLIVEGDVVDCVLDEATRLGATSLIVGSHGHGRLHHLLLGSTSEALLRRSQVPVTVVPVAER